MPFAALNGIKLYYESHGSGPAIIFAHGAGGNHLSWYTRRWYTGRWHTRRSRRQQTNRGQRTLDHTRAQFLGPLFLGRHVFHRTRT